MCPPRHVQNTKKKTEKLIRDRKAHPISSVGAELEDDHGQKSYLPQTTARGSSLTKQGAPQQWPHSGHTVATHWPHSDHTVATGKTWGFCDRH